MCRQGECFIHSSSMIEIKSLNFRDIDKDKWKIPISYMVVILFLYVIIMFPLEV